MTKPSSHASNLERLKKQKSIIDARIQAAEARLKNNHRKQDTRRKILVGSYYLDKAMKDNTIDNLKTLMEGYLKRDSDRKLFDLSVSSPSPTKNINLPEKG